MDPNACLDRIANLLRRSAGHSAEAREAGEDLDFACQDLFDWIAKGGFEPDWSRHESAASYYRCRAVHHRRGERCEESSR